MRCVGQARGGCSSAARVGGGGVSVGVRVVGTGTITVAADGSARPELSRDARTIIEGFEPGTGGTLWRFDAGRGVISQQLVPVLTDANTVVLHNGARRLVALDLPRGTKTPGSSSVRGGGDPAVPNR